MLKKILQKYFVKKFYPCIKRDWYVDKGYVGLDDQERFDHFIKMQKSEDAIFYKEFQHVCLSRQFIQTKNNEKLDSVLITPKNPININNKELYFVFFQGRGEYYESRFRDMAVQCIKTGASIFGFNPKGFGCSSGNTRILNDIVEDGIWVIKYLIDKYNLSPSQIILQGNSLGAGVQEMINEYFKQNFGFNFRQINSNSFKTLSSVIVCRYKLSFLEFLIKPILIYADWEIIPGENFYSTGIYKCMLKRLGDRTILKQAEFYHMINIDQDNEKCPDNYKAVNKYLYNNCQLILDDKEIDPHLPSLNHFYYIDNGVKRSVYELINIYIIESNKYI